MIKKTQHDTKKKKMKIAPRNPLPPLKDWKNEEEYKYLDKYTAESELWAWEFLRRNAEYRKDWNTAFVIWGKNNKSDAPNYWAQLFGSSCSSENYRPETILFNDARNKWGLLFNEIIDPDVDKPLVEYPYSLFYTYGYYYEKDDLDNLPDLKSTEVLAVFDMAKPIQQQLEYFKAILEDYQNDLIAYSTLRIPYVINKPIYWKDQLRIFDAKAAGSTDKEIAPVIYNEETYNNAQKKVKNGYKSAVNMINGGYRNILQRPSKMKRR